MNVPLWHEVVFGLLLLCIAEQNDRISITALWQIDVDSLREAGWHLAVPQRRSSRVTELSCSLQSRAGKIPGLAIDYTRSMKVNTAVELLVQESFQPGFIWALVVLLTMCITHGGFSH